MKPLVVTLGVLLLASVYVGGESHLHVQQVTVQEEKTKQDLLSALNTSKKLEKELAGEQEHIEQVYKYVDLLDTFYEAGYTMNTDKEAAILIDRIKKLPFGSPFNGGYIITSQFGPRDEHEWNGDGMHYGIDICPIDGSKNHLIYTTDGGEVIEFGVNKCYGKYILFQTDGGYVCKYAHLSKIFWQDSERKKVLHVHVPKGTKLGRMGKTGAIGDFHFNEHLHYEIHIPMEDGSFIRLDPQYVLRYSNGNKDSVSYTTGAWD